MRLATWNFSGLCSEGKQKEIGELSAKHNLDVVAGTESWEKEETKIDVKVTSSLGSHVSNKIV